MTYPERCLTIQIFRFVIEKDSVTLTLITRAVVNNYNSSSRSQPRLGKSVDKVRQLIGNLRLSCQLAANQHHISKDDSRLGVVEI